ncbi:MAG: aspartate aminotransferase family protein [Burkholderiales bacterium]
MAQDLLSTIAARAGERLELHARYLNANRADSARRIGLERGFVAAEGCWLVDAEGKRTLDCDAGNAVFAVGRNAPEVREAVRALLDSGPANWVTGSPPLLSGLLAEALVARMPQGLSRVLFTNTGSETVEAAMKLARLATGRKRFLCLDGDFHGLTLGALSITDPSSRLALTAKGYGPLLPGCEGVAWGDAEALERALAAGDVAAVVIEPVQGASLRVLPDEYLRRAQEACRRHGALFIVDEILAGLGRTGAFLAGDHAGVVPDAVLLAKGLSGGVVPVGAMVVRDAVWEPLFRDRHCFVHASTFGENDYAMAAGLATLGAISGRNLVANARERGEEWKRALEALRERHPMIAEVRGRGLLLGLELRAAGGWIRSPAARLLEERGMLGRLVMMWLLLRHRILASTPTRNNVLRLHPPLAIGAAECASVVAALDEVLSEAERFPDGVGRMLLERILEM